MSKSSRGFVHLVLVIGVVLVGIVLIGYFAYPKSEVSQNISDSSFIYNPPDDYLSCVDSSFHLSRFLPNKPATSTTIFGQIFYEPTPTLTQSDLALHSSSTWETYKNDYFGYQIDYPTNNPNFGVANESRKYDNFFFH